MISSQPVARNNLRTFSVSLPALRVLYTEEVDDEVVREVGEVGDVGDAEERGVEGEGEQRGRSHRPRSGSRAPFYSSSLLHPTVPINHYSDPEGQHNRTGIL